MSGKLQETLGGELALALRTASERVTNAESAYQGALQNLQKLPESASDQNLQTAQRNLDIASEILTRAREAYAQISQTNTNR